MSWLRAIICSGSSCRYSIDRMAASVPAMPRQRRPGHKPCLPRMKRRAVSMLMVSMITSWSKIGSQARGLPPLGSNPYHGDCNILQRERAISMILHDSLLVTFVKLVDCLPMPALPTKRGRGHPKVYSDRLFLKALVIMIVRHLHQVHELLCVLAQPTAEMATLRALLHEQGYFPSRRTWERRLKAIPETLPTQ